MQNRGSPLLEKDFAGIYHNGRNIYFGISSGTSASFGTVKVILIFINIANIDSFIKSRWCMKFGDYEEVVAIYLRNTLRRLQIIVITFGWLVH